MRAGPKLLAGGAAVVLAAAVLFAWNAASWLKRADPPGPADAVVVLAGRFERALYAADLFRQGMTPRILLSEPVEDPSVARLEALGIHLPSPGEVQRRILLAKGVPADRIAFLPGRSLSTADEAEKSAAALSRPGARILVVTSPSHALRARLIFEQAFKGKGAQLTVCANPYESLPDRWWRAQDSARDVLLEWTKLVFWFSGGHFAADG